MIWNVTVVPRMLYGADVFLGPALHCDSLKVRKGGRSTLNKLAAIHRSAVLLIVGRLHTLLNDVLDMHANLLPLMSILELYYH